MATKAEQIIDRFTTDPELKSQILGIIEEVKANPGTHNLDTITARFTDDPVLAAQIKSNFQKARDGQSKLDIASAHPVESAQAAAAAATMEAHHAAVEEILAS